MIFFYCYDWVCSYKHSVRHSVQLLFFQRKYSFPFAKLQCIIKLHRRASVGRGCALTYNSMNPRSRLKIFVGILPIFSLLLVQFGSILSFRDLVNRICEASFN